MITSKKLSLIVVAFFLMTGLFNSLYIVTEGQAAIVLRLGKIVLDTQQQQAVIKNPGLHIKWPLLDKIYFFNIKLQTLNVDSSRILTKEQKYVIVDYYAKWQIDNIPLYYTRTGHDVSQARLLLQQKINDSLRAEFGRRLLSDVISDARENIMTKLQQEASENAKELGIKVLDVRIKRIDLPGEVSASVFDRMRAERELVAMKHRSDGKAEAEKIQAEADAKATVIIANAKTQAASIRAQGEAKASKIYADAYNQDAEFYEFYRSLQAYRAIFDKDNMQNNIFVLNPNGQYAQFFKYFNKSEKIGG